MQAGCKIYYLDHFSDTIFLWSFFLHNLVNIFKHAIDQQDVKILATFNYLIELYSPPMKICRNQGK